ncbi:hypothetical protein ACFONG_15835 [Uliginosibacterium paludis]|uniref:Glycine zipper family protein n=1 Tax=Uliginosibacterium paludis TaxID=1615952 RepID=A0ABV2CUK5_9RHOO
MANGPAVATILSGKSASTPSQVTTPVSITGNEFETALRLFESEAAAFAQSIIKDPAARAEYISKTKAASSELIDLVKQHKITPHEAARTANAMRNQIMALSRSKLTDFGLAISRELKKDGPPLAHFEEHYARKNFGRAFSTLSEAERQAVWVEIVNAAGRSNKSVNMNVRWYGMAGRTLLVASLAFAVYNVSTAEDKPRQAAKEGSTLAAGFAGGAAGALVVTALVSNPAGWVVGAGMFVGAAIAGAGSSEIFDYFWPER